MLDYRVAELSDVARMAACRLEDPAAGPADERMGEYLAGKHHPQQARAPRIGYLASLQGEVIGYVAGHLTRRYECDGELQYLFVVPSHRRAGIASELVSQLFNWFATQHAYRICVNVEPANEAARAFYARHGAEELRKYWYVWSDIRALVRGAA